MSQLNNLFHLSRTKLDHQMIIFRQNSRGLVNQLNAKGKNLSISVFKWMMNRSGNCMFNFDSFFIHKNLKRFSQWRFAVKIVKNDCVPVFFSFLQVNIGDYVKLCPSDPRVPLYICRVISMWENGKGEKMFHGRWMRYVSIDHFIICGQFF